MKTVVIKGNTVSLDAALELMDDEIREDVHARINDIEPCTDQEFVNEYCRVHKLKYGKDFEVC